MQIIINFIFGIFVTLGIIGGVTTDNLQSDVVNDGMSQENQYVSDLSLNGQSPFSGPKQSKVKWIADIGGWGTEAVHGDDGVVFVGRMSFHNKEVEGNVFALHPDGQQKWVFYLDESDARTVSLARAATGVHVYAGGDGFVVGINALTGERVWQIDLDDTEVRGRITVDENEVLYFVAGTDNGIKTVYKVAGQTGDLIWKKDFAVSNMNGPALGRNGILYFGGDKVRAIDSVFGTPIWEYNTKTVGAFPYGPAIGPGGTIYTLSTSDFHLHAINPDGTLKWKKNVGFAELIPAIDENGVVYIHTWEDLLSLTDGNPEIGSGLHAINPDGTMKWSKDGFFQLSQNELNDEDIKRRGQRYGGSDSPIILDKDGMLYFGTDFGRMYAVDSRDGTVVWMARFRGEFDNRSAITPDGTLVFCHHGGSGLYEGPRCIGMHDNGQFDPSPGILVENDDDQDIETDDPTSSTLDITSQDYAVCFDHCVDIERKSELQCNRECDS